MADEKENKDDIVADLGEAQRKHPHLGTYLTEFTKNNPEPQYFLELTREQKKLKEVNLIYPVGGGIYIHIFRKKGQETKYHAVEPQLNEDDLAKYDEVLNKLIEVANQLPVPNDVRKMEPILVKLLDKVVSVGGGKGGFADRFSTKLVLSQSAYDTIKYFLIRNRIGYGKLAPLFRDPYLEDIHCTGVGGIMTVHKVFDMVHTNLVFKDDIELNRYVIEMSERVERPASDAHSVVDAMMPDGSRANFIYGRDVSLEGSSFTLRKFSDVPTSITQIVNWGTMSAQVAAYVWICLENGMNLFVCGETASGKTTSLNAICAFIKPDDKVYTVENTPEVTMPHKCWQHLLTREAGKSTDVTYGALLIASLRSRPNYILVGEIRGAEGSIAFQAMQTGHPVMATFHAGNITTMIQRLTGDPINVPIAFIDNLNIGLIQMAVSHKGSMVRRVLSVTELERYYAPANKMVTREVFGWDPVNDRHIFKGMFNSYILESKIAAMLGYSDPRDIYKELDLREQIINKMIENKLFNYYDVWDVIVNFHRGGRETLPFPL